MKYHQTSRRNSRLDNWKTRRRRTGFHSYAIQLHLLKISILAQNFNKISQMDPKVIFGIQIYHFL